jgi:hypothetical protein
MGDHQRIIPLPDDVKLVADAVTVPSSMLGLFGLIHWPTFAAILACLYTGLRIAEMVWGWLGKKK